MSRIFCSGVGSTFAMKPCGCGGTIFFRVPHDGEFSLKSGPDENKPLDCQQSKG